MSTPRESLSHSNFGGYQSLILALLVLIMAYLTGEISNGRAIYDIVKRLVSAGLLPNSALSNVGCYIAGSVMMSLVVFVWIIALGSGDDTWIHAFVFGYQNVPTSVVTTNYAAGGADQQQQQQQVPQYQQKQPSPLPQQGKTDASGRMQLGSDLQLNMSPATTTAPVAAATIPFAVNISPQPVSSPRQNVVSQQKQLPPQQKIVSAVPSLSAASPVTPTLPSVGGTLIKARGLYNYTGTIDINA
jgi:hypothetical protein